MAEFTKQQIAELGKMAETQVKSVLPKETHFLGVENDRAVFGVRLLGSRRTGLPNFVKVSQDGITEVVLDRNERFRLMDILYQLIQ